MRDTAARRVLFRLVSLTACAIGASCSPSGQVVSIADLTQESIVQVVSPSTTKHVTSLRIRGKGSIDGAAEIELLLNGRSYRSERLNGPVSFTWDQDWYSPSAEVKYRPLGAKGGTLKLEYRFSTS